MPEQRHVKLFRNGRNQAVRIPVEFELPGDEAIMRRDGDRLRHPGSFGTMTQGRWIAMASEPP